MTPHGKEVSKLERGEGGLLLRIIDMKKEEEIVGRRFCLKVNVEENKSLELIYFLLNQTFRAS